MSMGVGVSFCITFQCHNIKYFEIIEIGVLFLYFVSPCMLYGRVFYWYWFYGEL